MIDPNEQQDPGVNPTDICYEAFRLMKGKDFDRAEELLANNLSHTKDKTATALYHSALGVLFKMKKDFKEAWRHYQRAEKLIPNDPALKIIVARLLIEQFAEYGAAIKRAKKVLKLLPANPVFCHQAYTTMGLALVHKRKKKEAIEMLEKSIGKDFAGFITSKNIDFQLVEMLLRNGWGAESCCRFMEKALSFAEDRKENDYIAAFQKMLAAFQSEYSSK